MAHREVQLGCSSSPVVTAEPTDAGARHCRNEAGSGIDAPHAMVIIICVQMRMVGRSEGLWSHPAHSAGRRAVLPVATSTAHSYWCPRLLSTPRTANVYVVSGIDCDVAWLVELGRGSEHAIPIIAAVARSGDCRDLQAGGAGEQGA